MIKSGMLQGSRATQCRPEVLTIANVVDYTNPLPTKDGFELTVRAVLIYNLNGYFPRLPDEVECGLKERYFLADWSTLCRREPVVDRLGFYECGP